MTGIALRRIVVVLITVIIVSSGIIPIHSDLVNAVEPAEMTEYIESDYIIQNPFRIESDADFVSLGFEGSGVIYDPYIIQGLNITSTTYCIYITNTTAYFSIIDCSFTSKDIAIQWVDVSNGRIENCIFNRADTSAITIEFGDHCLIINCTISGSTEGISLQNVTDSTIRNSLIYRNDYGISVISAVDVTIRNNTVYGNIWKGIMLGLDVDNSTLYSNKIGWNGPIQSSNAEDQGQENVWYDIENQVGNEWSDYNATEPYEVSGSSNSVDLYASLLSDTTPPVVEGFEDRSFKDEEEAGQVIRWNATDEYPHLYQVYQNGHLIITEDWEGSQVEIILEDMQIGVYNYTMDLIDFSGNNATDTVIIIIYATLFGEMGTPIVMFASIFSVLSIVLLILILKRDR